jgi:AcrR family transcriptional regulator
MSVSLEIQAGVHPPTGLARRNRRLNEAETEQRMVGAGLDLLSRAGLTVGLDHISFEEVIREAGVSRSAVYRRWPYKDLFFSDLVKRLATDASPEIVTEEIARIKSVIVEHQDWLETQEQRDALVAEFFRRVSLFDFEALRGSARWRTYLALQATYLSLADGSLRDEVGQAMTQSEKVHVERVSNAWRWLSELLGYRLRERTSFTFESLAVVLTATMRGLVTMNVSVSSISEKRTQARPFGADQPSEWSLPALAMVALARAALEPDPSVTWDDTRRRSTLDALDALPIDEFPHVQQ